MKIVNILRDGTVQPPLQQDSLIVQLLNGNLLIGRYERASYLQGNDKYITEPQNAIELKKELIKLINSKKPELFSKPYVVHFECPQAISAKVMWSS